MPFFSFTLDAMKAANGFRISELTSKQLEAIMISQVPVALKLVNDSDSFVKVGYIKDYEIGRRFRKIIYIVADIANYDQSIMMDTDDIDLSRVVVFEDWMSDRDKAQLKALNAYLKKNPETGVVRNFCENCGNLAHKYFEEEEGGDGHHFCDPCAQHFIIESISGDEPVAIEGDILQAPEEVRLEFIAHIKERSKKEKLDLISKPFGEHGMFYLMTQQIEKDGSDE